MSKLPLTVTTEAVEAAIAHENYFNAAHGVEGARLVGQLHTKSPFTDTEVQSMPPSPNLALNQTIFCHLILRDGSKFVGINYGSVDPDQQDDERGRANARKEAFNKAWEHLTGALRHQRHVLETEEWATALLREEGHPIEIEGSNVIKVYTGTGVNAQRRNVNEHYYYSREEISLNDSLGVQYTIVGPLNGQGPQPLEVFNTQAKKLIAHLTKKDPLVRIFHFERPGRTQFLSPEETGDITHGDNFRAAATDKSVTFIREDDSGEVKFAWARTTPEDNTLSALAITHDDGVNAKEYTHMWRLVSAKNDHATFYQISIALGVDAINLFNEKSHSFIRAHLTHLMKFIKDEARKGPTERPEDASGPLWDFMQNVTAAHSYFISFRPGMLDDNESAQMYQKLAESMRDPHMLVEADGVWLPA